MGESKVTSGETRKIPTVRRTKTIKVDDRGIGLICEAL